MILDLTEQEIELIRAGLAAHSIALGSPWIQVEMMAEARQQQRQCRDLSIRLGAVLMAQNVETNGDGFSSTPQED